MNFIINIKPVPKGRPRMTRSGHCYTPKKTAEFEEQMKLCLWEAIQLHDPLSYLWYPREGALSLHLIFFYKKPRSTKKIFPTQDIDNLCKSVMDAGNGILWIDDKQICELHAVKQWGEIDSIELTITEVNDEKR